MFLVDANLLIYAHLQNLPQHPIVRPWLDERLNGPARVGLPWPSLLAFLRITTNPRMFVSPLPVADAWRQVKEWLGCPSVWIPTPTERHAEVLERLLSDRSIYGNLIPDAHLAALAIEHGLTLCSTDGDFDRFPDLRRHNPLAGG